MICSISTHALTWSATGEYMKYNYRLKISTHALTWSATDHRAHDSGGENHFNSRAHVERDTFDRMLQHRKENFNSRAHVERDKQVAKYPNKISEISTHALTWSATAATICAGVGKAISTHALTWSATSSRKAVRRMGRRFQLTRSRGARRACLWHF